jgi:hypothetical protein
LKKHPYIDLPERSFWSKAIASRHATEIADLFQGYSDLAKLRVATAGSCFAQHIGRNLIKRGLPYMDMEPPPAILTAGEADRFGYGVYSCRYGNIYTTRQLRQLVDEVFSGRNPVDWIWQKGNRCFDALRPGVEPDGFSSEDEVRAHRRYHLARVKLMFETLDVFVFTMGLTECWTSTTDGTAYPTAPGVIAGTFRPESYAFANLRYPEIYEDASYVIGKIREVNPKSRFILTVSPVPLAATATDNHVLVATTYSKSVLRAVAGDLADDFDNVLYFPSYEVITGQPNRHAFYLPDMRNVAQAGVDHVMTHFFKNIDLTGARATTASKAENDDDDEGGYEHCEEALLDREAV